MWNSKIPFEFSPGINSTQTLDGTAPHHCDLARQMYLEERQSQTEMERHLAVLAGWTTMSQWCLLTEIGMQLTSFIKRPTA
jgi:hypothetical protein